MIRDDEDGGDGIQAFARRAVIKIDRAANPHRAINMMIAFAANHCLILVSFITRAYHLKRALKLPPAHVVHR